MAELSQEQIAIIKKTWEGPAANLTDTGVIIFTTFLEKYPHNQDKFAKFRDIPLEQLKDTPKLRTHASRIMGVFDATVSALGKGNCENEIQRIWGNMADVHFRKSINRSSFEEMKGVILETLSSACKLDDTQQAAWVQLMECVYGIVYKTIAE